MKVLVVKSAFGDYARGGRITDPAHVAEVLAGENAHHVVASEHPDEPAPSKKSKPSDQ